MFVLFKIFPFMKSLILKIKWDNAVLMPRIGCPLFVISGDSDTFVPVKMT